MEFVVYDSKEIQQQLMKILEEAIIKLEAKENETK
jgi:hypothetical protein